MPRKQAQHRENSIHLAMTKSLRKTPYGLSLRLGPLYYRSKIRRWIRAFHVGSRTSQTVSQKCQIFVRFAITKMIVPENGPELVIADFKQWCGILLVKKMESFIYHPRANWFAEWAVQKLKRNGLFMPGAQIWMCQLFGWLQRVLMTQRNTFKTLGKIPVELLLGRKVRQLAVTDFDLC